MLCASANEQDENSRINGNIWVPSAPRGSPSARTSGESTSPRKKREGSAGGSAASEGLAGRHYQHLSGCVAVGRCLCDDIGGLPSNKCWWCGKDERMRGVDMGKDVGRRWVAGMRKWRRPENVFLLSFRCLARLSFLCLSFVFPLSFLCLFLGSAFFSRGCLGGRRTVSPTLTAGHRIALPKIAGWRQGYGLMTG